MNDETYQSQSLTTDCGYGMSLFKHEAVENSVLSDASEKQYILSNCLMQFKIKNVFPFQDQTDIKNKAEVNNARNGSYNPSMTAKAARQNSAPLLLNDVNYLGRKFLGEKLECK